MRIRRISADEAGALTEHLLRLDPPERRLRFAGPLSDAAVRAHCADIDWSRTVVHGLADGNGALRGAAQLALRADGTAEAGLSVEAPWRRRGHGRRLLAACLADARSRGATHLILDVMPENAAMRALAAAAGAAFRPRAGALECRIDWLPLPRSRPDPTS